MSSPSDLVEVKNVFTPQSLVRQPARRGGLLAESVVIDDRCGVVLATRTNWRDCQKLGQLGQHHGAACVGATIAKPQSRAYARLCLIDECPSGRILDHVGPSRSPASLPANGTTINR